MDTVLLKAAIPAHAPAPAHAAAAAGAARSPRPAFRGCPRCAGVEAGGFALLQLLHVL